MTVYRDVKLTSRFNYVPTVQNQTLPSPWKMRRTFLIIWALHRCETLCREYTSNEKSKKRKKERAKKQIERLHASLQLELSRKNLSPMYLRFSFEFIFNFISSLLLFILWVYFYLYIRLHRFAWIIKFFRFLASRTGNCIVLARLQRSTTS